MKRLILRYVCVAAPALIAAVTVCAQIDQTPSFDVASVRLTAPGTRPSERVTDTRVDLMNASLLQLLWMAFRIEPFCCANRLSAPSWVRSVSVDIQATIPSGGTRRQVPEMLKALLIQRFGLQTRLEPRPTDSYELVVDKGGIRMTEVEAVNELDRAFPDESSGRVAPTDRETADGRVRTMLITLGTRTITERTMYERTFTAQRTHRLNAIRMTMPELASILASNTGRPVTDRTGLTGIYTFMIELPPDAFVGPSLAAAGITTAIDGTPLDLPTGLSATKAVEQLGLRLEPRRTLIDTIVVERIERVPSAN